MTPLATDTSGKYVTAVAVNNGEITITYGGSAHTNILNATLVLTPYLSRGQQCQLAVCFRPSAGECHCYGRWGPTASVIQERYLPSNCRTGG